MSVTEHLLVCLIEECAEVQKAAAKALRFGLDDSAPDTPSLTNAEEIALEYTDLVAIIEMLEERGVLANRKTPERIQAKKDKVLKYMDYAVTRGTLDNNS